MPRGPNVNNNPMPTHVGPSVSVFEESYSQELVTMVEEIQTLVLVIREQLLKLGLIPANHVNCKDCIFDLEVCEKLKSYV